MLRTEAQTFTVTKPRTLVVLCGREEARSKQLKKKADMLVGSSLYKWIVNLPQLVIFQNHYQRLEWDVEGL
jgi:hypothetical protein